MTSVYPIAGPVELQLTRQGRTKRGDFRYTSCGFYQLAGLLGPGLGRFLPDLAGMNPRQAVNCVDGEQAIRIFNDLIDLRLSLFEQYRLVRNESLRVIEGLVGSRHRFLENLTMLRLAHDALPQTCEFYGGALVGRRLALWFRSREPLFVIDSPAWPMYFGYYFSNAEATGVSVRGSLALYTREGVCIAPYRRFGFRVTHAGRDFDARLGQLFGEVYNEPPLAEIREGVLKAKATRLGFTEHDSDRDRRSRVRRLVHSLAQLGISQGVGTDIVHEALYMGRHPDPVLTPSYPKQFPSRTLFDLFVAMLRVGKRLDLDRQERVGQAAFDALTGRLIV